MATAFEFEDPGEGIHEAEVLEVLVSSGDEVKEGQQLVVVETDKTSFELASPRSGTVADVVVSEGDRVQVGDTLLRYEDGGEDEGDGGEARQEATAEVRGSSDDSREGKQAEGESADARDETQSGQRKDEGAARSKDEDEHGDSGAKADEVRDRHGTPDERRGANREDGTRGSRRREGSPVRATPATRKLARDLEVDLRKVEPSGEHERVLSEDVRAHAEGTQSSAKGARGESSKSPSDSAEASREGKRDAKRPAPDFERWGPVERVPLRSIRRRTAERMAESWQKVARVTHQDEADITELERLRQRLAPGVEEDEVKLSLTVMVMKALAAVLRDYPRFNASLAEAEDELVLKRYVHMGVAVDTEAGLLVPVVRDVPGKSLRTLAREVDQIARAAREGKLERNQVSGGSFTLTNVGPIGGTGFTPIVNYPETAILGLGRARLQPVVTGDLDDHRTEVRLILPLSLSFDHRVIDGAEGARFARSLAELLADPDRFIANV